MKEHFNELKREIPKHKIVYSLLFIVLSWGFYLRVYNIGTSLGFYFDQGRDALVIWDLLHNGKPFLIGPTTGIAGIFRGPGYYYLITPLYLLGKGDPVWPSMFLSFTTILAILILFILGAEIQNRITGLLAATIAAFSFYIVTASRWLSNPTPMLVLSMILVWLMFRVLEGKRLAWVGISFVAGLSLFHFGSSGEFFYFPALGVFLIWQRKNLPEKKGLVLSVLVFLVTVLPLALFDIRHQGILSNNLRKFMFEEGSFKATFWDVVRERINFFYDVSTNKIFHWRRARELRILGLVGLTFLFWLPKLIKNDKIKIIFLLLSSPIIGLMFFQGNFGNIYDYYLTGYYLIFILLFSIILGKMWNSVPGKVFVIYFLYVFINLNYHVTKSRISDQLDGKNSVGFGNSKWAVEWVYRDAGDRKFNVDVYVPPVIPYAYDYLFKWYPTTSRFQGIDSELVQSNVDLLYTIYEADPPHPERLGEWLKRQEGIGRIEEEENYGGVFVQRRTRIH